MGGREVVIAEVKGSGGWWGSRGRWWVVRGVEGGSM